MPRQLVTRGGLPASDPLSGSYFANATLTKVAAPGDPDRNGDPGAPVTVWEGEAPCYLRRDNRTVIADGVQTQLQVDVLQIPAAIAAPVLEEAGPDWTASVITLMDRRIDGAPATMTFRVNAMENRAVGTILDHVRLELEHGQPA